MEAMSIEQGTVVVVLLSVLFVPLWCAVFSRPVRFVAASIFPIVVSVCLYWLPNLGQLENDELRAWAMLFIGCWFIPAVLVSIAATFIIDMLFRRRSLKKLFPKLTPVL